MHVNAGAELERLSPWDRLDQTPFQTRRSPVPIDQGKVKQVADAYTAAWNSGSADSVAEFFAPEGRIVINRGEPWEGRAGVATMAAGFYADVPDLNLTCDG